MQGCALRKIEGSPVLWNCKYDLYEKSKIFFSRKRKSWAPGASWLCQSTPLGANYPPWVQRKRIRSGGYKLYVIFEYVVFQSDPGARTSKFLVTFRSRRRTFSSFNLCPFLPSVATDDIKQFQCLIIVFNNKTGPLFFEFNWFEDTF